MRKTAQTSKLFERFFFSFFPPRIEGLAAKWNSAVCIISSVPGWCHNENAVMRVTSQKTQFWATAPDGGGGGNWGDLSPKQKWQAARPVNILWHAASVAPSPPLQHIRQTNGVERRCKTLAIKRPSVSHTSWGAARFLLPKQVWDCFAKELRRYRGDRWARLGFACCRSSSDESVAFLWWHSVRRQKGEWNKRALVLCPDLLGKREGRRKK